MSYIPRMFSEMGLAVMALVFIIAWGSDTAAYFCGTFFGKHKLIPKVSPKKTIEGAVGGVLGAVVGTLVICLIFNLVTDAKANILGLCLITPLMAVIGILGDLFTSAIKRSYGIKDYGNLIPGHGGALDRFDSLVMVAPLMEALLLIAPLVNV